MELSNRELFNRLKLWERELLDYARTKYFAGNSTAYTMRRTHAPVRATSSSSGAITHDGQYAFASSSSSRSYRAPTLSSFAKTSLPVPFGSKSSQFSPPTKDKIGKSVRLVRKGGVLVDPTDLESAEESPSRICRELCQVSSRLSGLVREIHDERLRSTVSHFCDEIGGYVSQEERRRGAESSVSDMLTTSSLQKHVEKLVENAVAPLQQENRELSWKVAKLEEELRHTEESESAHAKRVAELQACVENLKHENTRLNEEKAVGWKEMETELAKLKEDNRKIKEKMHSVVESNHGLQDMLKKRDADLRELQANTRSLVGTLMTCLDNIPPAPQNGILPAVSSASALTMTSSLVNAVSKSQEMRQLGSDTCSKRDSKTSGLKQLEDSNKKEAMRADFVEKRNGSSSHSVISVPKCKAKRVPSKNSAASKPSTTTLGMASTVSGSVGGIEADGESESDTELTSTDSDFASEFHNNLQQLDDYLRQLRGSLEKRTC